MELLGPKCRCESFEAAKSCCPVLNMPIFAGVPARFWDGFYKKRISNDYRKGNIIFYEGNRSFGMYFLCAGRVKIIRTDASLHSSIPRIVRKRRTCSESALSWPARPTSAPARRSKTAASVS